MRKILWLIPPLLGVVFYVGGSVAAERAAAAAEKEAAARGLARREAADASLPRTDGLEVGDLEKAIDAVAEKEAGGIETADAARLREIILQILKKWDEDQSDYELPEMRDDALFRLGELDRAAALAWVRAFFPDGKLEVMAGWAKADPDGAFEAIVHSDVIQPCRWETLMEILNGFGQKSPALLAEACHRVPLELFSRPGDGVFATSLVLVGEDKAGRRPWVESGAALELERQGVDIRPMVAEWVKEDPARALAQWQAGDGLGAGDPQQALVRLVDAEQDPFDQKLFEQLKAEIGRLDPAVQTRISSLLRDYILKQQGAKADEARESYGPLIDEIEERSAAKEVEGEGQ